MANIIILPMWVNRIAQKYTRGTPCNSHWLGEHIMSKHFYYRVKCKRNISTFSTETFLPLGYMKSEITSVVN